MSSGQQHLASGIGRGPRRGWLLVATLAASETTAYGVLAYPLAAALVAATLATTTVAVHLVAYLRKQHYSAAFAASWTGLLGVGSVWRTGQPRHTGAGPRPPA